MKREIAALLAKAAEHCSVGDFRDAGDTLRRVFQLDPHHAGAATQLAEIEIEHRLYPQAITRLLGVLRVQPHHAPALVAMARACMLAGRLEEALPHARAACALEPSEPGHRLLLARIMMRRGELDAARGIASPLTNVRSRPEIAGWAHCIMADLLEESGDPNALQHYQAASQLLPGDSDIHVSLGMSLLRQGQFRAGWDEYAWRRRTLHLRRQALTLPDELVWNGQPLGGRTIVLTDEQGLGDAIQFCRYVPLVAARGPARLIHVAFPALVPLFRTATPFAEVIEALPFGTDLHYHSTTMELARIFTPHPGNIPAAGAYLFADPGRIAQWSSQIDSHPRPRIGLAWSGNPTHFNDARRSIPAKLLLSLTEGSGSFFGLQPEVRSQDADAVRSCAGLSNLGPMFKDFADTAAAISGLDLVITVDTAVAHLAGAMGKPVWILLPQSSDWRWMHGREDSPWYPTARLFRCEEGGWPQVIARVREALHSFVEEQRKPIGD